MTSRCASHAGDSPTVTVATARHVPRASVGRLDPHEDLAGHAGVLARRRVGQLERKPEGGRELPCDPHDAHGIWAIGSDGELEDHVVETEGDADVVPERERGVERQDATVVGAEPELTSRAQHAVRYDAADLAPLEREAAWKGRARGGVRHDHARHDVGSAAHHPGGAAAEVDVDQRQLVGVRMRRDVEHPADDDTADLAPGLLDCLDLEPELVQRRDDLVGRRRDRRELPDPRKGRTHQYWARNRTSPSKNVLISSMS